MKHDIEIRKAEDREIDVLMDIYLGKVRWLRERGTPMWEESQFTRASLKDKYIDPEYYIAVKADEIIGGFILIEYDGRYWPENGADDAYYFHKFVIKNEYCGKGYSGRILRWVQAYGRAKGKQYIRLDFDERRTYLKNMYLANGFIPKDKKPNEKGALVTKAEYIIDAKRSTPIGADRISDGSSSLLKAEREPRDCGRAGIPVSEYRWFLERL